MKKLIYLFFTVLVVGCSGEDDYTTRPIEGRWNLEQTVNSCQIQSYMVLEGGQGLFRLFGNENESGDAVPCSIMNLTDITYAEIFNSSNSYEIFWGEERCRGSIINNILEVIGSSTSFTFSRQ